ncbi:MAG: PQQ-binding-like beta-propeller repeat protein [Pseudomonadota bacterium]
MVVQSGPVSGVIAQGTSINIALTAQAANFTPVGTLYASATDSAGILQLPVKVTGNGGGSYTFELDTLRTLPQGSYAGNVTIKLCSDAACNVPQALPSISAPYALTVLSSDSAWPGDKITELTAWSGAPDWSTYQGNNAHTGFVPVEVKPNQMLLRWKRAALNNSSSGYSTELSPLVTANGLFYASGAKKLTAYKELDGSQAWNYDVSAMRWPSVNPPAVDGGVVYMAAGQQESSQMMAFDAATGALRFRSTMTSQWENYLSPVVFDGAVYTNGGAYGGMYAFNLSGDQLFRGVLEQTTMWSPAADARGIYAYTGDSLTMFQPKTGTVLARITDNDINNSTYRVGGSAVIGANGGVYAAPYMNGYTNGGTLGNRLTRFDTIKGIVDWRVHGAYTNTPAYAAGVLYAPNNNPYRLEARAEADGALLWSWVPPLSGEFRFYSAPVVTNNLLVVSTNINTYAIDLRSRKVVWSYPAPGHFGISKNGVLYIQNPNALVAVNLK